MNERDEIAQALWCRRPMRCRCRADAIGRTTDDPADAARLHQPPLSRRILTLMRAS
jgi:hypothetical protein